MPFVGSLQRCMRACMSQGYGGGLCAEPPFFAPAASSWAWKDTVNRLPGGNSGVLVYDKGQADCCAVV